VPSAYQCYLAAKRAELCAQQPGLKPTEVLQTLGGRWNEIKQTPEASVYHEQAAKFRADRAAEEVAAGRKPPTAKRAKKTPLALSPAAPQPEAAAGAPPLPAPLGAPAAAAPAS
jgi:hypothetical protein